MGEKVLACIRVMMLNLNPFAKTYYIYEDLFLTSDKVIVARRTGTSGYEKKSRKRKVFDAIITVLGGRGSYTSESEKVIRTEKEYIEMQEKEFLNLPLDEILEADEHNFIIPKSDIVEVKLRSSPLKKHIWLEKLGVTATKKLIVITSKERYEWLVFPSLNAVKLEDYENTLHLAFPGRLSVE